jgi:hypothetical protein
MQLAACAAHLPETVVHREEVQVAIAVLDHT